ncbi:PREDICTED: arf-GAP with dual PH domain-containing protein 2 [Calidris pugnax]|uniref:arf-GAP with dual PH domain-containing protein 2 n=1 Tax=Calidris pugnax TaxID=198806 RepID=UPI00071CDC08|nr:PREDICTED: arf-GAP with dual PH domain-containing protein 2 [Calidris pugnax]
MDRDRNNSLLLELQKADGTGNSRCADCGQPDPQWASYRLGIFLCLNCTGIHRSVPLLNRVKSLQLDFWETDQIEFMKEHGNLCAKAIYEANVPPYYYIPQSHDCWILKEQWIRAKYERQEFVAARICQDPCSAGTREGFLWKCGRKIKRFRKRRFVLSAREGVMKYYTKFGDPKAIVSIEDLNAMFQTQKMQHAHGLQITYSADGQTRNLFVYHESGQEIVDWFNAIRAARYHYLRTSFPAFPETELIRRITRSYIKEGYMGKTEPKQKETFEQHWFCLDSQKRTLQYFKDPLDTFAQGQVFIGTMGDGYEVRAGFPEGVRVEKRKPAITVVTPERAFVFMCNNDLEQQEWINALRGLIEKNTW